MADPLGFDKLRAKLNRATTPLEVESVISEIERNKNLETDSRRSLLSLARELFRYLTERDASLAAISNGIRSAELEIVVRRIRTAVSLDDIVAATAIVRSSSLSDPIKVKLIAVMKKRKSST